MLIGGRSKFRLYELAPIHSAQPRAIGLLYVCRVSSLPYGFPPHI